MVATVDEAVAAGRSTTAIIVSFPARHQVNFWDR